jgi:HPt (histidine-containing phosphotransfer) domain-containing protein
VLEEAQKRDDSVELRHVVRLLKGSATTLGAAKLRTCCEELERAIGDGEVIGAEWLEELRVVGKGSLAALRSRLA